MASPAPARTEPTIHDVLRDFARPFLELGQSNGRTNDSQTAAALDHAALIWDLAVDGLSSAEIIQLIAEDSPRGAAVVEALVRRKQMFFADDRRYVIASRLDRRAS